MAKGYNMNHVYTINGRPCGFNIPDPDINEIGEAIMFRIAAYKGEISPVDPYNPLGLPPNTVRVRTTNRNAPAKSSGTSYETATLVSGTNNIYDVYKSGISFKDLLANSWNVAEVLGANTTGITNMYGMFKYCNYLSSVALFDTSSVTDMDQMFHGCQSLTSVPLFDTSSVTDMGGMFAGTSALTSVPLFNTSSVTTMSSMFAASSITTVPLFDTSSVTNMYYMFDYCESLTSVPQFNTSNVTDMSYMFQGCRYLTTVPLFNTSKVTNMSYMFQYCYSLTTIPLFDTSKVTNMTQTFHECTKVESGALALYQQASTQTTPPSRHTYCFYSCGSDTTTGAAELEQIPTSWGGTAT